MTWDREGVISLSESVWLPGAVLLSESVWLPGTVSLSESVSLSEPDSLSESVWLPLPAYSQTTPRNCSNPYFNHWSQIFIMLCFRKRQVPIEKAAWSRHYNSFMIIMHVRSEKLPNLLLSPIEQTDVFVYRIACAMCHRVQNFPLNHMDNCITVNQQILACRKY